MRRWLFPSQTLSWYVGKFFFVRFIAFLVGLILILQTLDLLSEQYKILAVPGNGDAEIWAYLRWRMPQLISKFIPFSVLLSALLTLLTLNQNSEVIIMKAAGLSAHQILRPLFATAILISIGHFFFNELYLMPANAQLDSWKKAEYGAKPKSLADTTREVWITDGPGPDIIHAEHIERRDNRLIMQGLTLYERRGRMAPDIITHAQSAILDRGLWQLNRVERTDVNQLVTTREPNAAWRTTIPPERFMAVAVAPDKTAFWELRTALRELKASGRQVASLQAGLYHKIASPLSSLLMPLLGAIAAFGVARSGKLFMRAVIGLAIGFAYFVADNALLAFGQFGTMPPILAAWAPFMLFFLLGEAILIRSEE